MGVAFRDSEQKPPAETGPKSKGPELDWPMPHHLKIVAKPGPTGPERGLVTMKDGRRLIGHVLRLDCSAAVLEFRAEHEPANLVIGFSSFKSVYLSRTIELEAVPLDVPAENVEMNVKTGIQKCLLQFKDGSDLAADTLGVVVRKFGLFLFLANYSNSVLRWFIPAEAITSYQLGDPIGKILVDRKIVLPEAVDAGLEKQRELRGTRLGDYLTRQNIVTQEQVENALKNQRTMRHLKLGDALIQEKLITEKQRDEALAAQAADRRKPLGEILADMGLVSRETVKRVLVEKLGIPLVNLRKFQFQANAIKVLSAELAHKHTVVPLYRSATRVALAMENPMAWESLQELEFASGIKIDPVMAAREDLLFVIKQFYGAVSGNTNISELIAELRAPSEAVPAFQEELVADSDNTLVRLVNKMILDAVEQEASDIHIESGAGEQVSRVRFRKDGVMVPYTEIPPSFRAALISRIKIMCDLDISEKRRPQDGKIDFAQFGPAAVELRVVTMPTAKGSEDIVMRILASPKALYLEQLGLSPDIVLTLKDLATKPYGLMFVCGPTGSGKTTTLHSLLAHINTPERKIWTVEDPIEITQAGLCQVQVHTKIGLTFPEVLRSFMRADPDVIMVGETRDAETAGTVIAASLTGHLVMSTMHTNGAVESVIRLLDFGLDPFNFSDALLGVLGQRLVRRLCPLCRKAHVASVEEIDVLVREYCFASPHNPDAVVQRWRSQHGEADGSLTLHSAQGCEDCDNNGYKGRLGMHELLVSSPALKAQILARAPVAEMARTAAAEGMLTLKQDGIEKVLQGLTDLKQVHSVCI